MGASIRRGWWGAVVLAVAGAGLGGCQSAGPAGRTPWPLAAQEGGKLSERQTADVQVALGRSYEKRGQPDLALAAYAEALKHDPKRTDAYVRLAILNDRQGKFQEAAEWYRKALRTSPGNPDIFCDMGYSLYLQRRWAEAEMNLQQALALKSDHARAHNNLGLVLAHTDRLDEALAHFRKVGTEAEAHLNLAFALVLDQHWEEARAQYELALAANPSLEQAKNGLRELDALLAKAAKPKPGLNLAPDPQLPTAVAEAPPPAAVTLPEQITQAAKVHLEDSSPETSENPPPAPTLDFLPDFPDGPDAPSAAAPAAGGTGTEITQARTLFRLPVPEP